VTRTASRKTKIFYLHFTRRVDDHQFTVFTKGIIKIKMRQWRDMLD